MLYKLPEPTTTAIRKLCGQYLAKNRLNARARARLAAEILVGQAEPVSLTVKQVAALCRVSVPYVSEARNPAPATDVLVKAWNAASPDERIAFARTVGSDKIWDGAIAPIIS
jgi:hypothetical protein